MSNKKPIYLDYNATTPIAHEVAETMTPYLYEHFGNPSSMHPYGIATKRAIEDARAQVLNYRRVRNLLQYYVESASTNITVLQSLKKREEQNRQTPGE